MNTELSSKYDPSAVEAQASTVWMQERCFAASPAAPGEAYSIVIPPPNVTGALHLGHAINATLQDILTRQHRMMGFNTLWVPGIDHAGIATQAVVEKQLKEQENKTRHDVGRDGLVERIWKWKQQYGDRILEQLKRIGASCDWDRTRFTLDEMCAKAVRETFFKLFRDRLIYRGKRLVNWDTLLQTSISDDEIYHETVKTNLWHIRYPIETAEREESRATYMVVATTRPETLLGDTAVAVHSEDSRWNWAIGKQVRLPLTGRLIPIIADDILVDPKFGTGVVKVTPAHDPNDYAVWSRHKGQTDEIELINILTPDGKINADRAEWSKYAGMKRTAARTAIVEDLKGAGLLEKEEPYETQVGHSDRSKSPVEPYLSDQWFVKMAPLAEPALQVVREGKIRFYPERHAQQYLAWLGEKRDWPVSRQLWWGHRIPVWRAPADSEYPFGLLHDRDTVLAWMRAGRVVVAGVSFDVAGNPSFGQLANEDTMICVRDANDTEIINALESWGLVQDPDVLDTWFSSALWPHSTLGWPEQTADLAKYYPTSVLVTGRDIITLWVARMVMMGMYNMGAEPPAPTADSPSPLGTAEREQERPRNAEARALGLPFLDVAINPTILDGKGERMSKSKGNGVDPVDIIDSYGADALRFTLTKMATETQDARMPVKRDANGKNTSEKFDEGRNFCNKLWNACRFALSNLENASQKSAGSALADAGPGEAKASAADASSAVTASAKAASAPGRDLQGAGARRPVSSEGSTAGAPAFAQESRPAAGPGGDVAALDDSTLTLVARWIISRFNRAVEDSNQALRAYRFDVYAKTCYDFFWRDFCDWYVEAIKPAMKDPARASQTAEALAAVLDGALRLMHPMIPFITETVWWRLNEVRPSRGLPGRLECPPSKRLVLAPWPGARVSNDDADIVFPRLQETIAAIRTIRNDYQVSPRQTVKVFIKAPGEFAGQVQANRELIELLGVCTLEAVGTTIAPVANAVTASAAGAEIFIEGLIDPNAEKARLAKELEAKTKLVEAMKGRLGNEAYIAKAPPQLVQQTKDQLAAAEAELGKLQEALRKLGTL